MKIDFEPHALIRARERGTDTREIEETIRYGEQFPAKKGRFGFRNIFPFESQWEGVSYRYKQVEAFAAPQHDGWLVITVITRFF